MNLRRVYITGPDCAGKTTFAKALAVASGMNVTKFSYEPDAEKFYANLKRYREIAGDPKEEIIMDRGWNGPFCYNGILGEQANDIEDIMRLNAEFTRNGGTILLFGARGDVIRERLAKRGDEFIKEDQLTAIWERYSQLAEILTARDIPYYIIDTSNV